MGKYEKILALGQGASADVFLMRNTRTQELFAVKKVKLIPGKRLRDRAAVLQEVALLTRLQHPHVVACHDHFFDADEQHVFIVQEYCEGGSLDEHIRSRREGHFSEGTVMRWFVQLALAVQYIHTLRILHRDIKTSNVFLTRRQHLKLGDFGIAKVLDSTIDLASTFVGTPYYLSPELCQDVPYSAKADIWALGCLLFELCALRPPFEALSLISLFKKIVEEDQAPLPSCYSEALHGLIRAILQKDPAARPSAATILDLPYVQEHLSLFHLQEEPPLLQKRRPGVFQDGEGGGLSPPALPAKSSPDPALAPPSRQQAEQHNDPAEGLSSSSSGSHYSADFEESSTSSSSDNSSGRDTPSTTEATETAESAEEWDPTDYPTDFEDSEEGSLEEAMQDGQSSPSSSPLGGFQNCSQLRWKEEDGSCGSDEGSSSPEVAAQACLEHSSSTEDSEHLEACYLLRLLELDSP